MRGKQVFYPIGWDDNGLATERRVQNYFGVRCDPSLPYDPAFDIASLERPDEDEPVAVSRRNFIDLCDRLTVEDEKAFEDLFRRAGWSVDWNHSYTTIGERSRRVSQRAFLHLVAKGVAYTAEAPTMWDVDFNTAVAQAEIEDREQDGLYHRIAFDREDGATVEVETSRPELLPACVALVAHPGDARYATLTGTTVLTPMFRVPVPVFTHELADPEKGTGIAMVCTFGDLTDVTWWRELDLPLRAVIQSNGTLGPVKWGTTGWESESPAEAQRHYDTLAGMSAVKARSRVVDLLRESGAPIGEPRPITHPVKFYEKGDRPLEIVTSRQWFIRTNNLRAELIQR